MGKTLALQYRHVIPPPAIDQPTFWPHTSIAWDAADYLYVGCLLIPLFPPIGRRSHVQDPGPGVCDGYYNILVVHLNSQYVEALKFLIPTWEPLTGL